MTRSQSSIVNTVLVSALAYLASADVAAAGTDKRETAVAASEHPRRGKVTLSYSPSENFKPQFESLRQGRALFTFVEHINGGLVLPKDLPVYFAECGEVNAFYRSATGDITICYEIVQRMTQDFLQLQQENANRGVDFDADDALTDAITFVFFHELGHALIDIYDLGVTKEEDAVDGLATALLLHLEGGGVAAIHGATAFRMISKEVEEDNEELAFWDDHSFGLQRFFNIGCWVYGKLGGDEMKAALRAQGMQDSRLNQCPTDFRRLKKSWKALLGPWLLPDANDAKGAR
jgi:hypothetical protein